MYKTRKKSIDILFLFFVLTAIFISSICYGLKIDNDWWNGRAQLNV